MAPLTLAEKYNDLVRCADQPLSSYDKLNNKDFEDVISKIWPFIIESITCLPLPIEKNDSVMPIPSFTSEIRTKLERRLKIHFQLYSEAAKRHQQKFPNRKPMRKTGDHSTTNMIDTRSLSIEPTSTFSFDNASKINIPDFYVFCSPKHTNERKHQNYKQLLSSTSNKQLLADFDRVKKYLMATTPTTSSYKTLVFKQALKECCHCGNYYFLTSLCSVVNMHIENIYFDNNDTVLHESIKLNNKQLTSELIRHRFNIEVDGELGTPLVTAIHYNILWAVEMLLNNGADLTKRHIDWPFLTLYQYCIQFTKIDIKVIIDKYITSLIRKQNYRIIEKLIDDGWNICLKKRHS